jgi:dipeptidyl aminopeptidase/acylaminoacyl peptidase
VRIAFAILLLSSFVPTVHADLAEVDAWLGEVSFDEVQISPDGSRIAFIVRKNDIERDREELSVWLLRLEGGTASGPPVRLTSLLEPSGLRWSPDGKVLSYLAAEDEESAPQLFMLDPTGGMPRRLSDPAKFAEGVSLYDWLPDSSGLIFVTSDPPQETAAAGQKRKDFYGDVRRLTGSPAKSSFYRVGIADARAARIDGFPFEQPAALAISPDGDWLAASGSDRLETISASELLLLPLGPQAVAPQRTRNSIWEESFAWAGDSLFVAGPGEEQGRYVNTEARLYRIEGHSRLSRVNPELQGYIKQVVPLADGSVLVTANVSTLVRVSLVEAGSGKARTLLDQRGWIGNLSASRDGGAIAFVTSDARHFPEIYVARGPNGMAEARPVTDFNAALTRGPLPEIETVSWDDGEGGTVEGVLFWPPGQKGEKGLPLVVDLHGGPFSVARTEAVSLQATALYIPGIFAARGFLVLTPNYRGSAGRGDAFSEDINGRRCSRPSQDVILGVESLVARGWADRQRLGLMGYSAGGGLSKCLLGRTDLFRAVSTGAGVWNDLALYGSRRGLMWAEVFYRSTSPWTDFELWWRESPVNGLERIKTPTLVISGERDGDAPRHGDELYRGLLARGVTVEHLIFPGEGHIFSKPSHKRTKMRAEISWFEHYLLGKPRPELP